MFLATHFTFLGVCTEAAPALFEREGEDPIRDDPDGVDRAAAHARIAASIAAFLRRG